MRNLISASFLFLVYFFVGLITLPDYGINWDSPSHLVRGQAFLHYYLSGEGSYENKTQWKSFRQKEEEAKKDLVNNLPRKRFYFQEVNTIFFKPDIPKEEIPRISIYQNTEKDLEAIIKQTKYGHPHISDVLASIFNFIFFQKLGFLNDIDSYRVYGLILAASLVGLIFYWISIVYGRFAGLVAAFSLALYPLFWAESHFNIEKDIPETVFFAFLLISFWKGIVSKKWRWVIVSGLFFGLASGTKLNVVFAVFIILPWLIFYIINLQNTSLGNFIKQNKKILLCSILAPFVGLFIIFTTWPYFWSDPVGNISQIINFYTNIGSSGNIEDRFVGPLGINTYAFWWILVTTPLPTLSLSLVGLVYVLFLIFNKKNDLALLILLWFIIPILRVTWPGANIYGGVRQIMEFIPAMAILSGIGAGWIVQCVKARLPACRQARPDEQRKVKSVIAPLFLLITFYLLLLPIIKYHPYENVYFNELIGGLKGAKERDIPGWGVSFGSPYRHAIDWVNKNVEPGSKLTLSHEIMSNIPGIWIRPDIDFKRLNSGYLRQGEYVISLTHQGTANRSYNDMYLNNLVKPVYEIKVDGVPILKIWKNDINHLKSQWQNEKILENIKFDKTNERILFDIGKQVKLSRLEIEFSEDNCQGLSWGYFTISKDGKIWERLPGVLPEEIRINVLGKQPKDGKLREPLTGQEARYINFFYSPEDSCVSEIKTLRLYYFN